MDLISAYYFAKTPKSQEKFTEIPARKFLVGGPKDFFRVLINQLMPQVLESVTSILVRELSTEKSTNSSSTNPSVELTSNFVLELPWGQVLDQEVTNSPYLDGRNQSQLLNESEYEDLDRRLSDLPRPVQELLLRQIMYQIRSADKVERDRGVKYPVRKKIRDDLDLELKANAFRLMSSWQDDGKNFSTTQYLKASLELVGDDENKRYEIVENFIDNFIPDSRAGEEAVPEYQKQVGMAFSQVIRSSPPYLSKEKLKELVHKKAIPWLKTLVSYIESSEKENLKTLLNSISKLTSLISPYLPERELAQLIHEQVKICGDEVLRGRSCGEPELDYNLNSDTYNLFVFLHELLFDNTKKTVIKKANGEEQEFIRGFDEIYYKYFADQDGSCPDLDKNFYNYFFDLLAIEITNMQYEFFIMDDSKIEEYHRNIKQIISDVDIYHCPVAPQDLEPYPVSHTDPRFHSYYTYSDLGCNSGRFRVSGLRHYNFLDQMLCSFDISGAHKITGLTNNPLECIDSFCPPALKDLVFTCINNLDFDNMFTPLHLTIYRNFQDLEAGNASKAYMTQLSALYLHYLPSVNAYFCSPRFSADPSEVYHFPPTIRSKNSYVAKLSPLDLVFNNFKANTYESFFLPWFDALLASPYLDTVAIKNTRDTYPTENAYSNPYCWRYRTSIGIAITNLLEKASYEQGLVTLQRLFSRGFSLKSLSSTDLCVFLTLVDRNFIDEDLNNPSALERNILYDLFSDGISFKDSQSREKVEKLDLSSVDKQGNTLLHLLGILSPAWFAHNPNFFVAKFKPIIDSNKALLKQLLDQENLAGETARELIKKDHDKCKMFQKLGLL